MNIELIKQKIRELQDKGLPIIILQDPISKLPSITFTFLVVSGVMVILGLVGKFVTAAGGIDIENALSFFYGCSATYLGRKFTSKSGEISNKDNKE
jgi:hypothetical protein